MRAPAVFAFHAILVFVLVQSVELKPHCGSKKTNYNKYIAETACEAICKLKGYAGGCGSRVSCTCDNSADSASKKTSQANAAEKALSGTNVAHNV